jgi:divalent metal cation (Fe/Co/Zn/Cd) transporter
METNLERFAWLSIAAAIATIALKALAWWLTGSVGLLSDALESLVNLAAALLMLSMLRLAATPPGQAFPYGLSKAEYISAGVEGALIVLAAGGILYAAIPRLITPESARGAAPRPEHHRGSASLINFGVAVVLTRAGKRHDSITLEADGPAPHDRRVDLGPASLPASRSSTSPAGSASTRSSRSPWAIHIVWTASASCAVPSSACSTPPSAPKTRTK